MTDRLYRSTRVVVDHNYKANTLHDVAGRLIEDIRADHPRPFERFAIDISIIATPRERRVLERREDDRRKKP